MLNEKRIRLMTRMAMYEQNEGKEDLKISAYYQKDYASLNAWITVIWITIGYAVIAGGVMFVFLDQIFNAATISTLLIIVGAAAGGYLVVAIITAIFAYDFYRKKHVEARKRVKRFNQNLSRLGKMYEKERR